MGGGFAWPKWANSGGSLVNFLLHSTRQLSAGTGKYLPTCGYETSNRHTNVSVTYFRLYPGASAASHTLPGPFASLGAVAVFVYSAS